MCGCCVGYIVVMQHCMVTIWESVLTLNQPTPRVYICLTLDIQLFQLCLFFYQKNPNYILSDCSIRFWLVLSKRTWNGLLGSGFRGGFEPSLSLKGQVCWKYQNLCRSLKPHLSTVTFPVSVFQTQSSYTCHGPAHFLSRIDPGGFFTC